MKLNQLALATLALAGASQAFAAAPVQYLTGASASSVNVMKATRNLCAAAGGTFNLYKTSTSTSALGNVFTGVCSTALLDAPGYTTVAMNVSGGSANAVLGTASVTASNVFLNVGAASCTGITGTEALAASVFGSYNLFACSNTTTSVLSDGGFLDVEGTVFPASVLDPSSYNPDDFQLAGISQAFGVAVSSNLYDVLQTAQFGTTCNNTSVKFTAACQPSISKAQIGSLINNAKTSFAKTAGGKFLIGGSSTDATQIVYCMRPQTSGTQQSAQLYFLNYGANGNILGGVETIINNGLAFNATSATAKFAATLNSGSSDVRSCLNSTTTAAGTGTGYRFGILSLENNPLGGSDTYRFVKLNGVAGAQGTGSTDSNTATAVTGEYDFVFETTAYCKNGTCPAVVDAILNNLSTALPTGASTAGLFTGKGVESRYSRGSGSTPKAAAPYIIRY